VLLASGTARPMTERPDEHRLLAQYLAEVRKKPLLTHAQELALGEQKNAGAKARQQLTSGSFLTQEEGMALAEHRRAGDQAHTALVEGNVRYVVKIAKKYAAAGLAQGLSFLDVIQEGVPAVLEQKTTICCKLLCLLTSKERVSPAYSRERTHVEGVEENPFYG
jgi:DNA-directed RNA polymerase sigma subunit (sigma70/sigma32)